MSSSFVCSLARLSGQVLLVFNERQSPASGSGQAICSQDVTGSCVRDAACWTLFQRLSRCIAGVPCGSQVLQAFQADGMEATLQGNFLLQENDTAELSEADCACTAEKCVF